MNAEKSAEQNVHQSDSVHPESLIGPEVIRDLKLEEARTQLGKIDLLLANITPEEAGRMGPERHRIQDFLTKMQAASLAMEHIDSKPN